MAEGGLRTATAFQRASSASNGASGALPLHTAAPALRSSAPVHPMLDGAWRRSSSATRSASSTANVDNAMPQPIQRSDTSEVIRVAVRVRPFNEQDRRLGCGRDCVVSISELDTTVKVGENSLTFASDAAFWSHDPNSSSYASQEDVFNTLGMPLLAGGLTGYSGCVIAYGQTGAGKSHSMIGSKADPGILPRLVEGLLQERSADVGSGGNTGGFELRVWLTAVEVFGECVRDLLSAVGPAIAGDDKAKVDSRSELLSLQLSALQKRALALGASRQEVDSVSEKADRTDALVDLIIAKQSAARAAEEPLIIQHPSLGVQVVGAVEAPCAEATDVTQLLDYAAKKRAVGSMNVGGALSSRSHAFFFLRLDVRQGGRSTHSRLTLVDLAGSERMGQTSAGNSKSAFAFIRDGKAINRSLATLGWIVRELGDCANSGQNSVPFQLSKLTFALKDALIGNSRTWFLAAVSPVPESAEETAATLRFSESVRRLRTHPRPSRGSWAEILSSLQEEASKLRVQVATGLSDSDPFRELALVERQRLIEELHRPRQFHADEGARLAREREQALISVGLMTTDAEEAFAFEQVTPYLLNMSDDPQLAGSLLYFLRRGEEVSIGCDTNSPIVVSGLNVLPRLCSVMNHDNVRVSLLRPDESRRCVLLNGQALPVSPSSAEKDEGAKNASEFRLRHQDRLYLGLALVLRLHIPMQADVETIDESEEQSGAVPPPPTHELVLCRHPRECLPVLPERSQAFSDLQMYMQHSESFSELQLYMEDLYDKLDADRGHAFFRTLQEACHLIDEANAISRKVRPDDRLHFEVEFVWDIYRDVEDILMIRVMHCGESPGRGDIVLHYWTYDKFKDRLDVMRDVFFIYLYAGWPTECKGDIFEDPWIEPGTADLQQRYLETLLKERKRAAIAEDRLLNHSTSSVGSNNARPNSALARIGEHQNRRLSAGAEAARLRASPRPLRPVGNKAAEVQTSARSSRPLNKVSKCPQSGTGNGGAGPDACAGDGALVFGYQPTWPRANTVSVSGGRATHASMIPMAENERLKDLVVSLQQQLAAVQLKTDSIDQLREQVHNMQTMIASASGAVTYTSPGSTVVTSNAELDGPISCVPPQVVVQCSSSLPYQPLTGGRSQDDASNHNSSSEPAGMRTPSPQVSPYTSYISNLDVSNANSVVTTSPTSTYPMPTIKTLANSTAVRRASPLRTSASPARPPLAPESSRARSPDSGGFGGSNNSPPLEGRSAKIEPGVVASDLSRSLCSRRVSPVSSPVSRSRAVAADCTTAANIQNARPNSPPALPMRAYHQGGSLTVGASMAPVLSVRPLSPPGSLQVINSASMPSLHPISLQTQASPLSQYRDIQASPFSYYRNV